MKYNLLIDTRSDSVSSLHVVGSIPATNILALQISIETFGEGLVFTGIADETAIILDRLSCQINNITDESIIKTYATQE